MYKIYIYLSAGITITVIVHAPNNQVEIKHIQPAYQALSALSTCLYKAASLSACCWTSPAVSGSAGD